MSCSNWDVHCLDCHEDAGMSATNHGLETVRLLIEHREKLEPLERFLAADGVWSMGFAVNGEEVIASFFGEHKGHRIGGSVAVTEHSVKPNVGSQRRRNQTP